MTNSPCRDITRRFTRLLCLILLLAYQHGIANDFSELFESVDPAVVILHTFSENPDPNNPSKVVSDKSLGTGVMIDKAGKILTAAHVVHSVDSVHVIFRNGQKIHARVIASEPKADLALLQLDFKPDKVQTVKLGNSDKVKVGQEIAVIGTPYGLEHTLTVGHVSARYQPDQLKGPFYEGEFFQTDAAINKGNSGGPVFNTEGELIGIVSHIQSQSGGSEGLGFAVTINTAKRLLLEGSGFWSGIEWIPMGELLARAINYPKDYGVLVQRVAHDSPSDKAGIQGSDIPVKIGKTQLMLGGDIIVSVAGIPIKDKEHLRKIKKHIKQVKPGGKIKIKIYRSGQFKEISFTKQ